MCLIGGAQAEAGQFGQARQSLAEAVRPPPAGIESFQEKFWALGEIAAAQEKAVLVGEARQTFLERIAAARRMQNEEDNNGNISERVAGLANELAEAGKLADALTAARAVKDADKRVPVLCKIALAEARGGKKAAARQVLAEALGTARSDTAATVRGCCAVAAAESAMGLAAEARRHLAEAQAVAHRSAAALKRRSVSFVTQCSDEKVDTLLGSWLAGWRTGALPERPAKSAARP